ncbi:MAG: ParB/RepB/Spo0J family partition protein [Desulfobacterales bacterium]|nr:ParB/RepB/Spo0J family partition protein [Desulfobacterales bacterium]
MALKIRNKGSKPKDLDEFINRVDEKVNLIGHDENIVVISIKDIKNNPYQPRKTIDNESIKELAASIKEKNQLTPIIVNKDNVLVAGQRRILALKLLGKNKVKAIIIDVSKNDIMEISIIENIQREDLNYIEEAESINNLSEIGYSNEIISKKISKDIKRVYEYISISKLPDEIKNYYKSQKKIKKTFIKSLINKTSSLQLDLFYKEIGKKKLEKKEQQNIKPSKKNGYRRKSEILVDKFSNTSLEIEKFETKLDKDDQFDKKEISEIKDSLKILRDKIDKILIK